MKKKILLALVFVAALAGALIFVLTRNGAAPKEALPLADAAKKAFADFDRLTEYDGEEFFDIVGVSPDDYTEFIYRPGNHPGTREGQRGTGPGEDRPGTVPRTP